MSSKTTTASFDRQNLSRATFSERASESLAHLGRDELMLERIISEELEGFLLGHNQPFELLLLFCDCLHLRLEALGSVL